MKFWELCIQTRIFAMVQTLLSLGTEVLQINVLHFQFLLFQQRRYQNIYFWTEGQSFFQNIKSSWFLSEQVNFWHRSMDLFPLSWCFYISFTSEVLQILVDECDGRKKYISLSQRWTREEYEGQQRKRWKEHSGGDVRHLAEITHEEISIPQRNLKVFPIPISATD